MQLAKGLPLKAANLAAVHQAMSVNHMRLRKT